MEQIVIDVILLGKTKQRNRLELILYCIMFNWSHYRHKLWIGEILLKKIDSINAYF